LDNIGIFDIESGNNTFINGYIDSIDIYEDVIIYEAHNGSGIIAYDLSMDRYKLLTEEFNETYQNPAIYEGYVVFEYMEELPDGEGGTYLNSRIYYYFQEYKLDIGNDDTIDWRSSKVMMVNETTVTFNEVSIEYYEEHAQSGALRVPLVFYSDVENFNFSITDIDLHVDFLVDPLDVDTDGDKLWDGEESFLFAGFDMIEAEDTLHFKEWGNPKVDLNEDYDKKLDTMINQNGSFINRIGVTLTTSDDYVDSEGVLNSWVKYNIKIEKTGKYRFIVNPECEDFWGMTDSELQSSYGLPVTNLGSSNFASMVEPVKHVIDKSDSNTSSTSYSTPDTTAYDFGINYTADEYLRDLVEGAFYFKVNYKTRQLEAVDEKEYPSVRRAVMTSSPQGLTTDNLSVYADWSYQGEFELVHGVEYTITIGADYRRIPVGLERPSHVPVVNFIRMPTLDKIRVEKQGLDPLAYDADRDGLPDGFEFFGNNMYPLNPDADGDGLNDYVEMFVTKTDFGNRDSDFDGIIDGVECGIRSVDISDTLGEIESPGSWFERIAHSGDHSPFDLTPIKNFDMDPDTTTDPLDYDTDDDGIPDGWIDGWSYNPFPFTFGDTRSYHINKNRNQYFSYWRYDEKYWGLWEP
jgi:hypothetical protein